MLYFTYITKQKGMLYSICLVPTAVHALGTRHMLYSDMKNLNIKTPYTKPRDIYQQNSTNNNS